MNLQQTINIFSNRKLHGRLRFQDLDISIENRKGSTRRGVAKDGTKWATKMTYPYGYVRMTEGADGDHVDCFIGPNKLAKNVYIIHIMHPHNGKYDEDKCFLGFDSKEAAKKVFDANYDRPERFYHGMTIMTMQQFKKKVADKENHGEKLEASDPGYFLPSVTHIDFIPSKPTLTEKQGKSRTPRDSKEQQEFKMKLLQNHPQPFLINHTAGQTPQGSTTPFAFVQVYSSKQPRRKQS